MICIISNNTNVPHSWELSNTNYKMRIANRVCQPRMIMLMMGWFIRKIEKPSHVRWRSNSIILRTRSCSPFPSVTECTRAWINLMIRTGLSSYAKPIMSWGPDTDTQYYSTPEPKIQDEIWGWLMSLMLLLAWKKERWWWLIRTQKWRARRIKSMHIS